MSNIQSIRAEQTDPMDQYAAIPMSDPGNALAGSAMSRGMFSGFSLRPRPRGIPNPLDQYTAGSSSYRGQ